jgi:hypothetical protein
VSASALAELAVVCEDMATRLGPPRDRRYRDLAAQPRESGRRKMDFVDWEDGEIRRLFGTGTLPRP